MVLRSQVAANPLTEPTNTTAQAPTIDAVDMRCDEVMYESDDWSEETPTTPPVSELLDDLVSQMRFQAMKNRGFEWAHNLAKRFDRAFVLDKVALLQVRQHP